MLLQHYSTGMKIDTLLFDEVRADDELVVTSPEYVNVPPDMLPELQGTDFWWKALPPSGESLRRCFPMAHAPNLSSSSKFEVSPTTTTTTTTTDNSPPRCDERGVEWLGSSVTS